MCDRGVELFFSGMALLVAAMSLAWNILLLFFKRPRVVVAVHKHVKMGTEVATEFRITVLNNGTEPVTIWDVGLTGPERSRQFSFELWRAEGNEDANKELPAQIGAHDSATWVMKAGLVASFRNRSGSNGPYSGYALRFKRPLPRLAKLPRGSILASHTKMYVSPNHETID